MSARQFAESVVEDAAWFGQLGWTVKIAREKRILRKYGYPPDKQEKATQTVLEQAEVLSEMWAAA